LPRSTWSVAAKPRPSTRWKCCGCFGAPTAATGGRTSRAPPATTSWPKPSFIGTRARVLFLPHLLRPLSLPLSLLVLVPVKVTVAMAALALFLLPLLLLQESCEPRRHHRLRAFTREFASRTPSLVFEEGQTTDVRSAMCYQRN